MKKILLSVLMIGGLGVVATAQLHDQTGNTSTNGIVSNQYIDLADTIVQCADDFIVPGSETWDVNQVSVRGFRNGAAANMTTMTVQFFADAGGSPGAMTYTEDVTVNVPGPTGDTLIVLNITTQSFTAGTHWVSVYGHAEVASRWNWTGNTSVQGANGYLLDTEDFFGAGATTWTDVLVLVGGDPDFAFALDGTSTGGGASIGEETLELSLYPNPAVEFVQINTGGNAVQEAKIFNAAGQLISTLVNPDENKIDVADLPAGMYIVEVTTATGTGQARFIKD